MHPQVQAVTERIIARSRPRRQRYLQQLQDAVQQGKLRGQLVYQSGAYLCGRPGGGKTDPATKPSRRQYRHYQRLQRYSVGMRLIRVTRNN